MQRNSVKKNYVAERKEQTINRREFLKTVGVAVGTAVSAYVLSSINLSNTPAELKRNGEIVKFRGSSNGKIIESFDHGGNWHIAADFGEECDVRSVTSKAAGLLAKIEYRGFTFELQSSDGRNWYG